MSGRDPAFGREVTRGAAGVDYAQIYAASDFIPSIIISGVCCTPLSTTAAVVPEFDHVFQVRDDLTRVIGSHTLKAGVLVMKSLKNQDNQAADQRRLRVR